MTNDELWNTSGLNYELTGFAPISMMEYHILEEKNELPRSRADGVSQIG
jgi:hypothetical protein